jgi:DNA polymerase (family 10)
MIRGFDEARVRQSIDEIAAVRRRVPGIEVLHGLEVDILADGALDLADDALELLDWVVIALHTRLEQDAKTATDRVVRALQHPAVHAMAHPTARIIGAREGVPFDVERVFEVAAERGVAMEINSQPDRIDLSDAHARLAQEKGVRFVIDTDAHSAVQLDYMRFGVFAARRAGLTSENVLNALPYLMFREKLRQVRKRRPPVTDAPAEHEASTAVGAGAGKAGRPGAKRATGDGKPADGPGKPGRGGGGRKSAPDERQPPATGPKSPRRPAR